MAGKNRYGITLISFLLQVAPPRTPLDEKAPRPDFYGTVVHKETGEPRRVGVHLTRVKRVDVSHDGYHDRSRPLEQIRLAVAQLAGWHPDELIFVQHHAAWVEDSLWAVLHQWADEHIYLLTSLTEQRYWSAEKGWVNVDEATWFTQQEMMDLDLKQFGKELNVTWREMPEPGFPNPYY
jgi:hypothetical protein